MESSTKKVFFVTFVSSPLLFMAAEAALEEEEEVRLVLILLLVRKMDFARPLSEFFLDFRESEVPTKVGVESSFGDFDVMVID